MSTLDTREFQDKLADPLRLAPQKGQEVNMTIDEIRDIMEDGQQGRIEYIDKDGVKHTGYVDVYESPYDNGDEDGNDGEASICFDGDNGEMLVVFESEIQKIRILSDDEA